MKPENIVILSIFVGFIVLEILFTQFFNKEKQRKGDGIVELVGTLVLTIITQPLVLAMAYAATAFLRPDKPIYLNAWRVWRVMGFLEF